MAAGGRATVESPAVSVVVNNYNYARFVPRAVASALAQAGVDAEVIVVDDGSIDQSREILDGFRDRAEIVFQDNRGQAAAINAGVKASRGEIICFLDADDWWAPGKLAAVVAAFRADAGASASFGSSWLLAGGLATIAFGAIGVLASQAMGRLAGFYVLVSSGTLLAAIGMENAGVTAGALYYMVSSTLAISAFFLLIELVERAQDPAANVLAVTMEAYGDDMDEEEEEEEVGVAIPATLAVLGVCFASCAILLAGMPPLSGFIGKFALLAAAIQPADAGPAMRVATWTFFALVIFSGLSAMLAMMRAGIRTFWAPVEGVVPRVLVMEIAPVAFLLLLCLALTVQAGAAMRYMEATAQSLHQPSAYLHDVLSATPVPGVRAGGH